MQKFINADFCFIRTPAFPLNLLQSFLDTNTESLVSKSRQLKDIFSNDQIKTALHASTSPELFIEFNKWLNNATHSKDKEERMKSTLIKYLVRMTTRCVPFALFSGFNIADIGNSTSLNLGNSIFNTTHMRLDMEYLQDIFDILNKDENIKRSIKYFPNNSMYKVNNKYKYIEHSTDTYVRKYNYSAVDIDDYLNLVLNTAKEGSYISEITNALNTFDNEISFEEVNDYIEQLISSQLLVSELQPLMTGPDNLDKIIETLERSKNYSDTYLTPLKKIKKLINTKNYSVKTSTKIKSLVENITGSKGHWSILQSDLEIKLENNQIGSNVINTISSQIQELNMFAYGIDRPALKTFIFDFQKRFDLQEIPLVTAIDPEIGVGYGNLGVLDSNDLLNNIPFAQEFSDDPIQIKTNHLTQFITEKYTKCIKEGSNKIEIGEKDLAQLRKQG
ncbi:MAG TPA: lantibiotic dehydratase, partial [Candidatus Dojkabacteria bacterium]|nr:lantibiotic dehydratase [Candidatus Dojkabacteria bacterium]